MALEQVEDKLKINDQNSIQLTEVDGMLKEGLLNFYASFRRLRFVLAKNPTDEDIAWEHSQMYPNYIVTPQQVGHWRQLHQTLCATFSTTIERIAQHYPAGQDGLMEYGLSIALDHSLLMLLRTDISARGLVNYLNRTLSRRAIGIASAVNEHSISRILKRRDNDGEVEVDRFIPWSTDFEGEDIIDTLESIVAHISAIHKVEVDFNSLWKLYTDYGLTGMLQQLQQLLTDGEQKDSLSSVSDGDNSARNDSSLFGLRRSRRYITVTPEGERIADGWSVEQIFSAINRLPVEFRWLALEVVGYLSNYKNIRELYSVIGDKGWLIDKLPKMIQRRLIPTSMVTFNLQELVNGMNETHTTQEVHRRLRTVNDKSGKFSFDSRRDLAYRLLRNVLNTFQIDYSTLGLSNRQISLLEFLEQNQGIAYWATYAEALGYNSPKTVAEDATEAVYKIISSLPYSFDTALEVIRVALAEKIIDLTELEERYIRLHYGIDSGHPQYISCLAKNHGVDIMTVRDIVKIACLKIIARIAEMNNGKIIPIKLLTKQEITDLQIVRSLIAIRNTPMYRELSPRQRMIVEMYYGQNGGGASIKEIASVLSLSYHAVHTHLDVARKKIINLSMYNKAVNWVLNQGLLGYIASSSPMRDFSWYWGLDGSILHEAEIANRTGRNIHSVRANIFKVIRSCTKLYDENKLISE